MLAANYSGLKFETGTDEAGRGCLAGPVTAAAVTFSTIVKKNVKRELFDLLNDSKKTTEIKRNSLKPLIERFAINFSVCHITNEEIDEINILNASMKAMQECVLNLEPIPDYIIVDGNTELNRKLGQSQKIGRLFTIEEADLLKSIPNKSIVKGDAKYLSIAAASILAKTYRDEYMNAIHLEYPMYNWKQNKGYPTKEHRAAIAKYGITKYHRKSFQLLPKQYEICF